MVALTKTRGIAPFGWFGGKQSLVPTLLSLLPPHEVYVEVFGGAASLLCSKRPSSLEVYNDLDSGLVNFFRVLRDKEQYTELAEMLRLTPFAREEWKACYHGLTDEVNPVEFARRWFVAIEQSFSRNINANSWRHSVSPSTNAARAFRNAIERLDVIVERFSDVQIEHDDFARIIRAYDDTDVFFYLDPPYVTSTRRGGGYRHEMSDEDHIRLLKAIQRCKGMVLLSGYDHPLYREYLPDWRMVMVDMNCAAAGRTKATGIQGKGSAQQQQRTECIWIKPNTIIAEPKSTQTAMWDETTA